MFIILENCFTTLESVKSNCPNKKVGKYKKKIYFTFEMHEIYTHTDKIFE